MARTSTNKSETTAPNYRSSSSLAVASKPKMSTNQASSGKKSTMTRKGKEEEKITGYDCSICWDVAKEPVVTSCGHLYCWPCLFYWMRMYSKSNECPLCKGNVTGNIFPIYGGESSTSNKKVKYEGLMVPARPRGRRVENFRRPVHALSGCGLLGQVVHGLFAMIQRGVRPFFGN